MTVVLLRKEWVEVWQGLLDGRPIWFVEYFKGGAGMIVSECPDEASAIADAEAWELPIIRG